MASWKRLTECRQLGWTEPHIPGTHGRHFGFREEGVSEIPTKDEGKKPLFCRQNEDGEWVAIGYVEPLYELGDGDVYGMDMSNTGLSFNDSTVEFTIEASIPAVSMFRLIGEEVVNIIFCKDCKHKNDPLKCPYYKFDATDDHDFCSRGEKNG